MRKDHTYKFLKFFVGRMITNVEFDGDRTYGLRVRDAGGNESILWILRDPEGNGPGHLDEEECERLFEPKVGDTVVARVQITEGGVDPGNPLAQFPHRSFIHAEPGDKGIIRGFDSDGHPNVTFERTGTTTLAGWTELLPR